VYFFIPKSQPVVYRYFASDNEPDGIENATHNTFAKLDMDADKIQVCFANVLWVAFSIAPGSLSLVKYPVFSDACLS
jgi:hypothetical protein